MRVIGHLANERNAALFSDYLVVQGIANEVEADKEGWAIWIHSEDEMERAHGLLQRFRTNPDDPTVQKYARKAQLLKEQHQQEAEAAEKRQYTRRQLFPRTRAYAVGPVTVSLIVICAVVAILSDFGKNEAVLQYLFLSLPEVSRGEVWRLLTPIVVHFGILHLAFNMLWLFDLGTMIERCQGTGKFVLLVVVLGVLSNVGEYLMSGPFFGGMSGVVYGLLGYIWMKGKFDPLSGLILHPQTVAMMLVWFFLCLSGLMGHIANTAHAVGLVLGIVWGYLSSQLASHRR